MNIAAAAVCASIENCIQDIVKHSSGAWTCLQACCSVGAAVLPQVHVSYFTQDDTLQASCGDNRCTL